MSLSLDQLLTQKKPLLMGILNLTPDSFSDGGRYLQPERALARVRQMCAEGADIIDLGGESTRPGAEPVSVREELERVIPVIDAIRDAGIETPVSVDTSKPEVMRAALDAGAAMINDVRALQLPGALEAVASSRARVCLMHMQGTPGDMQQNPVYQDLLGEVQAFLQARVEACERAGIARHRIIIDPGFGFGKTLAHNLRLLRHLDRFCDTGLPVLAGLSRKSMIGAVLDLPVDERLYGSLACALIAADKGAAIIRVHDVAETRQVLDIYRAVSDA